MAEIPVPSLSGDSPVDDVPEGQEDVIMARPAAGPVVPTKGDAKGKLKGPPGKSSGQARSAARTKREQEQNVKAEVPIRDRALMVVDDIDSATRVIDSATSTAELVNNGPVYCDQDSASPDYMPSRLTSRMSIQESLATRAGEPTIRPLKGSQRGQRLPGSNW